MMLFSCQGHYSQKFRFHHYSPQSVGYDKSARALGFDGKLIDLMGVPIGKDLEFRAKFVDIPGCGRLPCPGNSALVAL